MTNLPVPSERHDPPYSLFVFPSAINLTVANPAGTPLIETDPEIGYRATSDEQPNATKQQKQPITFRICITHM
jgi:hypothetical protein